MSDERAIDSDEFSPLQAVAIREDNHGYISVGVPETVRRDLDLDPGQRLFPMVQNGLLVYVPAAAVAVDEADEDA